MITALNSDVLVILMDESVSAGLQQASETHRWPVLRQPTAGQALREIRMTKPRVVLVQVSGSVMVLKQTAALVRWLRSAQPAPQVAAIATDHTPQLERTMRSAGVGCYLTEQADSGEVDQTVTQLTDAYDRNSYEPRRIGA